MKHRKFLRVLIVLAVLCALVSDALLINDLRVASIGSALIRPTEGKTYDCILVLGALVYGTTPSPMLKDRLDAALDAYHAGLSDRILVSGDREPTGYDEVDAMRIYLENAGVPPERIFLDFSGFDTYDSLYRAREKFHVQSVYIPTQRFHLVRALYIAKELGLSADGVDATRRVYGRELWYDFREIAARFKAFLDCEILHFKLQNLGATFPIQGSGLATRNA